jgi:hypothetical protein
MDWTPGARPALGVMISSIPADQTGLANAHSVRTAPHQCARRGEQDVMVAERSDLVRKLIVVL